MRYVCAVGCAFAWLRSRNRSASVARARSIAHTCCCCYFNQSNDTASALCMCTPAYALRVHLRGFRSWLMLIIRRTHNKQVNHTIALRYCDMSVCIESVFSRKKWKKPQVKICSIVQRAYHVMYFIINASCVLSRSSIVHIVSVHKLSVCSTQNIGAKCECEC